MGLFLLFVFGKDRSYFATFLFLYFHVDYTFFSHSHVVSNLYNVFLLWNTKEDILKMSAFLSIQ